MLPRQTVLMLRMEGDKVLWHTYAMHVLKASTKTAVTDAVPAAAGPQKDSHA